jgi:hypothetical protein
MPTQEDDIIEATTDTDVYVPNRASRRAKKPAGPQRATLDMLRNKKPREKEVTLPFPTDGGGTEDATFLFRSIGAKEWELLVSKHKPTNAQRADGQPFNTDTFPPALLARVCVDPAMAEEEWSEIWTSPDWNRGEISDFYAHAVNLCTEGFDVPFNGSD